MLRASFKIPLEYDYFNDGKNTTDSVPTHAIYMCLCTNALRCVINALLSYVWLYCHPEAVCA